MAATIPVSSLIRIKTYEFGLRLNLAQSIIVKNNLYVGLIFEEMLRSFFAEIMPRQYKVTQGFVQNGESQSGQCDIILYDYIEYAPYHNFKTLDIIPAKAVKAVIEVKSSINRSRFQDTLKSFKKLGEMGIENKYLICHNSVRLATVKGYFFPSNKKESNHSDFLLKMLRIFSTMSMT